MHIDFIVLVPHWTYELGDYFLPLLLLTRRFLFLTKKLVIMYQESMNEGIRTSYVQTSKRPST